MIKIAVASNINFCDYSLPIVLESLISAGIEKKDICVFNSGFLESEVTSIDGITHYKMTHNSFEYSPLIEIVEREIESEYWFLIHDTCKVGPDFKRLLYNIPENKPEKLALKYKPSMSIGTYRYDYLLSVKDKLLSIKNTDFSRESLMHWKRWGVPNEDFILWMTEPQALLYNNIDSRQVLPDDNWYKTDTHRIVEYYPSLDLYKNKSNWGQSWEMVLTI